jgi:nascent polypeptide-associated complex subunit alpha
MIPNIDPRALKSMMDRLGMKSKEINASRVIIESEEKNIVIENPQVIAIDMQGSQVFQITGTRHDVEKSIKAEVTEEDIAFVSEQSGVNDTGAVKKAIEESNGDLASAIMKLKQAKA